MEPFIGQICAFGFNYAPRGWAPCDGRLLSIAENNALFALLGTMYGGDGQRTFGLPDLRGRVMLGVGQGRGLSPYTQGQMAGDETVTLTANQMPAHTHVMMASTDPQAAGNPAGSSLGTAARGAGANVYSSGNSNQVMMGSVVTTTGGSQAHSNQQPYLAINYCIALQGVYPQRD